MTVSARRAAAIVTVGSELTEGLRVDTNTAEIARSLAPRGFEVTAAVSVADDPARLVTLLGRLVTENALVITTGGLGPTHDDITREAAAAALGRDLATDPRLVDLLQPVAARHADPRVAEQVLVQAQVIEGAEVIDPTTGTAPGLVLDTPGGLLVLLPGPPREMRPMLDAVLGRFARTHAAHRELGVTGMPESDVQMAAQDVLAGREDVGFTVLASLGDVRVLLADLGAGDAALDSLVADVAERIGEAVYSTDGSSLAAETIRSATVRRRTLACAESCTGGLVGAALTEVPGASDCFLGSIVTYANQAKIDLLDVPPGLLAQYGAVSEECARAMAEGARSRLNADIAVAVTGVAGPSGGTADKPVGLVWFAIADARESRAFSRKFGSSSRGAIRARATATALDSIRRALREA